MPGFQAITISHVFLHRHCHPQWPPSPATLMNEDHSRDYRMAQRVCLPPLNGVRAGVRGKHLRKPLKIKSLLTPTLSSFWGGEGEKPNCNAAKKVHFAFIVSIVPSPAALMKKGHFCNVAVRIGWADIFQKAKRLRIIDTHAGVLVRHRCDCVERVIMGAVN
jgi:hypothetical protein